MKLAINEPCHEDWNKMKIGLHSRHCSSCEKKVIDFTSSSRAEILSYLLEHSNDSTCGRLRSDQFDFQHSDIPIIIETLHRKNIANPFLILTLISMSLVSCAQESSTTKPPIKHEIMGKMAMTVDDTLKTTKIDTLQHIEEPFLGEVVPIMQGMIAIEHPEKANPEGEKIYKFVDKMPEFPGGVLKMMEAIDSALSQYKIKAKGRAYVQFVVGSEGKVSSAQLIQIDEQLIPYSNSILEVILNMEKWNPGIQEGEKVAVQMTLPIIFK